MRAAQPLLESTVAPLQSSPSWLMAVGSVRFCWPTGEVAALDHEFFAGYWQPAGRFLFDRSASELAQCRVLVGESWVLLSSRSPRHADKRGLVHEDVSSNTVVGFRGYVLEPPTHSYSDSARILAYWSDPGVTVHNGTFAAAVICRNGRSLTLLTDVFGLAPLYYRQLGPGIAFSTSPRFLAAENDTPDLLSWRTLLQCGFISCDRSLTTQIQRIPAGKALKADVNGARLQAWFDFESLPRGQRRVGPTAAREVEDAFQVSMDRCLRLSELDVTLPLSSGHDSRRILAALLSRGTPFEAITARVFQKGHRDLDARFSSEMARDFGFRHRIIEPPDMGRFVLDDAVRRTKVDAETQMHTWVVRLFDGISSRPNLIFDGILGDILGNPGYRLQELYRSPAEDIEVIVRVSVGAGFDRFLRRGAWPSADAVREELRTYLRPFLDRINLAEFAFILLRQRRMTATWSQQLTPPGNVVVCPFADLDYLKLLLDFLPADKHGANFQRRCLESFWPEFAKYPGNRDIPADLPPGRPTIECEQEIAALSHLRGQIAGRHEEEGILNLLTLRAAVLLRLASLSRRVAMRTAWYAVPLMELVQRETIRSACWTVE